MAERREPVEGYEAVIHRAIWERPTTLGAPRMWAAVWLGICLYAALCLLYVSARWAILPLVVWALGQGLLVMLTQFDPQWDDIGIAQMQRRYKSVYEAG